MQTYGDAKTYSFIKSVLSGSQMKLEILDVHLPHPTAIKEGGTVYFRCTQHYTAISDPVHER